MELRADGAVVRKIAETGEERARLAGEAGLLSIAAHPGVVRLVQKIGDPPSELILAAVRGGKLSDIRRTLDWCEVAGLGAAVATTLADLHDIGVAHRSISAEHVLLDEGGRPVICGFGSAKRCKDSGEARAGAAADAASLVTLLLQLGDASPPRSLARVLRAYTGRRQLARGRPCRRLARSLIDAVPSARLPGSDPVQPALSPRDKRRLGGRPQRSRIRFALVCGLGSLGLLSGARAAITGVGNGSDRVACPGVDAGCSGRPMGPGSVISTQAGRFMLVGVTGVEVTGRWHCGEMSLPAVLDLASGDIWMFDLWPAASSGVAARLAARVPGASGLGVVPGSGRISGCDGLLVYRRGRAPTPLKLSGS